jgi:hypothetical protein
MHFPAVNLEGECELWRSARRGLDALLSEYQLERAFPSDAPSHSYPPTISQAAARQATR